jgi:3-oxoadipate enol-lactonase
MVLGRWFTSGFQAERPAVVSRYREMLVATPREGYAAGCEAIAGWDFRSELASIRAPTLVVAGAEDPATPVGYAELLLQGIPTARIVVLPDAAHLANVERAPDFNRALAAHLSDGQTIQKEDEP